MGLLNDTTQSAYYQGGEKGGYQFTSLEDIVSYFMVIYVGEGKTVSKVNRTDVAFHAQRAMQELSFDTFKSVKSQEIVLPPSNTMMLPHDYVNYTKLSWSDGAGIKHPLYPTSNTSNPFKIEQNSDGSYDFKALTASVVTNGDFSDDGDTGPAMYFDGRYQLSGIAYQLSDGTRMECKSKKRNADSSEIVKRLQGKYCENVESPPQLAPRLKFNSLWIRNVWHGFRWKFLIPLNKFCF